MPLLTLTRHELGEAGLAYIRERLEGGETLAHLLLEGIDLRQGAAWAYLPAGLPEAATLRIDEGIMGKYRAIAGTRGAARPWDIHPSAVLEQIVLRFLRTFPNGIVVCEDFLSRASDPWIEQHPEESLVFLDEEVYGVALAGTATRQTLNVVLESLDAWCGSPAVLATLPEPAQRRLGQPRATIAREAFRPLVNNLQLLAFRAYDREACVYWSPSHSVVDISPPLETAP